MVKSTRSADTTTRTVQAGLLTWLLPGLGHYLLGHRVLAIVFFVAITVPYLTGLAVGGVANSVNPRTNRWLFLAEMGIGGYTVPSYFVSQRIEARVLRDVGLSRIPDASVSRGEYRQYELERARYVAYYPESDIAQIYLATAGLLNLLAILDAISRAQTGGLPTYHRSLAAAPEREGAS